MSTTDRIDTGYSWETTTDHVLEGVDLTGKRAIVTGASSGIGVETARALASKGAAVTLAVRNVLKGEQVAADIRLSTGNENIDVRELELSDLDSVRAFVAAWEGPLDILVNNAGVMNVPTRELTKQGWELQFGANHLGHFALTVGLHDALKAAGTSRVVSVASGAHHFGGVDFDDINFDNRPYGGWPAYGQAKTANILFAVEAAKRWGDDGITINSLHPGNIRTELHRHTEMDEDTRAAFDAAQWKTPAQGAATSILLAASPVIDGVSGRYFEDVNQAEVVTEPGESGVQAYALDEASAAKLWDLSIAAIS